MASDPTSASTSATSSYTASLAPSSTAAPSDEAFPTSTSAAITDLSSSFPSSISPMANSLLDDDEQYTLSGWARTLQYSPQIFPTLYSTSHAHSDSSLGNFGFDLGDSAMMAGPSSFKSVVGFGDSPLLGPTSRSNIGDGLGPNLQAPPQPTIAASRSMLPSSSTSVSDFDSFASSFNFDTSLLDAGQTPQTIEEIYRPLNEVALTTPALSTIANGLPDPTLQTPPRPKDDSEIRAYAKLEFATSDFYIQKLSVIVGRRPAAATATSASPAPPCANENGSIKLEDFSLEAGETQILLREGIETGKGDSPNEGKDAATSASSTPVPHIEVTPNSPGPSNGGSQPRFATSADASSASSASTSKPNVTMSSEGKESAVNAKAPTSASLADIDLGPIRAVSRHHARIYYSEKKGRWKVEVLGRNGVVVDGQWKGKGERTTLKHRTKVQIAERVFHFVLPATDTALSLDTSPEKRKKKTASKNRAAGERAGSDGESEGRSSSSLSDVSESDIELSPFLDTKAQLADEAIASNASPSKIRLTLSLGPGSGASTPDSKSATGMAPQPPRPPTPSASPISSSSQLTLATTSDINAALGDLSALPPLPPLPSIPVPSTPVPSTPVACGSGGGGGLGKGLGKEGKGATGGKGLKGSKDNKGGKGGMGSMGAMGGKGGKDKGMGKTIISGKTKFPHGLVRADAGSDSSSDSDSDDDSDEDGNTTAIAGASSDEDGLAVPHLGKGPGKMPQKAPRKQRKTTTEPAAIALKQLTPSASTFAPVSEPSTSTAAALPTLPDASLFASLPDLPALPPLPGEAQNATAGKKVAQLPSQNGSPAPAPTPASAPAPTPAPASNASKAPATSPAAAVATPAGLPLVHPPSGGATDSASVTDAAAPPPPFVPKPPSAAYVAAAADVTIPTSRLPHTPAPILKAPLRHAPFQPAPMPEGDPPHEAPPQDRNMRPPYTYGSLIAQAVSESEHNKMTMAQVYEWIDRRWPFFRENQPGWQNSVRHNLTPARGFVKIDRRPDEPGKGAFWTIDPAQLSNFGGLHYRKKNLGGASKPKPAAPPVMGSFAPTSGSTPVPSSTTTATSSVSAPSISAPSTSTSMNATAGMNAASAVTRPPPPNPPSTGPALSVPLPIVVGPIPDTYVRPTPPPSSAPPDEITAALLRDPPIVLHEGKLIINPIIFAHLSKEQIANLETLPASNALQILQAYVVQHFKEKMKRIADEKAAAKARAEKAATEKLAAEKLAAEAAAAKKSLEANVTPSSVPPTGEKAESATLSSKDAPKKATAASASTSSTSGKKQLSSTAASKRKATDDGSSPSTGASKALKTEEGQTTKK
ncbi:BQ2448_4641 [Microbotryum intermedium]|uniref:BQ2448_4641 protein n=1 Tax=Microbotryum intermedium TaxID=269621 RepID=A0A238FFD8_9BASI|nr:BQ2448_4641 [Microbotryum intermedium]